MPLVGFHPERRQDVAAVLTCSLHVGIPINEETAGPTALTGYISTLYIQGMNEDASRQAIDDQDRTLGVMMAYFSQLASTPEASETIPGSELDKHYRQYPDSQQYLNPAYLAWRAFASASEHAGFAEHMRFITTGGVVPRPQTSLARVTLLGAARALYVLMPDDPCERIIRAAKLANQEAKDARRMLEAWQNQTHTQPDFLGDLESQTREVADSAEKILVDAGLPEGSTINEISMLKNVVSQLSDVPSDAEEQLVALWSQLSGVSHARSWTWSVLSGEVPQFDFVHIWTIPVDLLAAAWEFLNLRRGGSTIPNLPPEYWQPDRRRWGKIPAVKHCNTRNRIGLEPVPPNSSTHEKDLKSVKDSAAARFSAESRSSTNELGA